jgi:aryl-alcohol dehydrogenase-like predicted oxidoreductase
MINKMVLGTVQLGMDYGINNRWGKPTLKEAFQILEYAYDNGIKIFDTAQAYGNAEEIIGEFIKANEVKDIKIISKLKPNLGININLEPWILKSLVNLNLENLYGFLFHTSDDILSSFLVEKMKHLKNIKLIENWGVSVYEEIHFKAGIKQKCDFIQIPYNLLDQRINYMNKKDVTVFGRAPFLQGLLVMEEQNVLSEAEKYLIEIRAFRTIFNIQLDEIALLFACLNKNINYIVFGVERLWQLVKNISIIKEIDKYEYQIKDKILEFQGKFGDVENHIIFPSLWSKK